LYWLPVVLSALLWPALMCGAFWGRFGIGDVARELAMCAPFGIPGALAGLVLGALLARARGPWSRKIARLGYVIAVPPAWWGVMMGGHVFSPFVGSMVYGALPLALGSCLGYLAGRRLDRTACRSSRHPATPA
jgi:hypothetical protein